MKRLLWNAAVVVVIGRPCAGAAQTEPGQPRLFAPGVVTIGLPPPDSRWEIDMMIRLLTCLLAVGLLPLAASAQANSDSIKHRNDCRLAIQVITTGQPAARSDWAMTFVRECAGFPAALRNSLSAARNSRDTAALARLTAPADWLRDGDVFTAAFELARDRGASPVARVFAIRVMMWVYLPVWN